MSGVLCPKCGVKDCGKHCLKPKRQGDGPCRRPAGAGTDHPGFGACDLHLGDTPTGKKHAATLRADAYERILTMIDPALTTLLRLVKGAETDAVTLAAVRDVLDRGGLGVKHIHEHTGPGGGPIPVEVRTAELLARAQKMRPPAKATTPKRRKAAKGSTKGSTPDA